MTKLKTQTINVLSVRQPFASWIVYGSKFCENRTWSTSHRDRLYIHASSWSRENGISLDPDAYQYPVPTGVILGHVELLGCWDVEEIGAAASIPTGDEQLDDALTRLSMEARNFFGWDSVEGPVCWLLADRKPLTEPIPVAGKLRIWKHRLPFPEE